ncbi:MAG: 50S ribosomal protein L6 [Candidatus Sericytochromatia bacterium]|nr:50S ribosomal protein L6 [Candidatus Sericytochromatia bacterium]
MSRIGKRVIPVPAGATITLGPVVTVTGPKGTLTRTFRSEVTIAQEGSDLTVTRKGDDKTSRSLHGLSRTLLANMVQGVTTGFAKTLEIIGVGYRFQMAGSKLAVIAGFSHPQEFEPPSGVEIKLEGANKVTLSGCDKQAIGDFAAEIRSIRPPEPYKGKGIKYQGEKIRRKAGKTGGKKK